MSFAKKSTNKEDVKQQASNYITSSGFYPLTILASFVSSNGGGGEVVDFFVASNGQEQVLYGNMRIHNNDVNGEKVENKIGMSMFNHLLVIADIDEVSEPVDDELPIGKGGAGKMVAMLEDLADIEVTIRIQLEYSSYQGNIQEKRVIRGFYRAGDNATAEEVVNDENFGNGFEKDKKYADNITYKDDLTPDDIARWVAGGRKGTKNAGGSAAASKPGKKASFGAGKKRFAGSK